MRKTLVIRPIVAGNTDLEWELQCCRVMACFLAGRVGDKNDFQGNAVDSILDIFKKYFPAPGGKKLTLRIEHTLKRGDGSEEIGILS